MSGRPHDPPPVLGPASVLWLSREGGLAHFPGLAAPRCIRCAEYSDAQRRWLGRLLEAAQRRGESAAPPAPDAADCRVMRLTVDEDGAPTWALVVAEDQVPKALIELWQRGGLPPDVGPSAAS